MTLSRFNASAASLLLAVAISVPALAQGALRVAPSGRATTTVTLAAPRVQGQPAPKALKITIDHGVPVARGRAVAGALADDLGKVWRLGANEATSLVTDVDLDLGGKTVPKGSYTLFVETTKGAWSLIVNKKTGEWGTDYDKSADLVHIPLKEKILSSPVEALVIQLIPGSDGAKGELRLAWGTLEHSVAWSAK